jgi:hypothetical protein
MTLIKARVSPNSDGRRGRALWYLAIALITGSLSCELSRRPATHFPITSGRPTALPPHGATLHVVGRNGVVTRSTVAWLEHHGYRIRQEAGADATILCEVVEQPAIWAGITPEVIIRLEQPPGTFPVILGRAMMPTATGGQGILRDLTCQALATAWGYRPSGQLDIPSEQMCTAGMAKVW